MTSSPLIDLSQLTAALASEEASSHGLRAVEGSPAHAYAVVPTGSKLEVVDLERMLSTPTRKRACVRLTAPASFASYVARHASASTELWADPSAGRCVAVLDGNSIDSPGWGAHTATLALGHTGAWERLAAGLGKALAQAHFAAWVEENADLIVSPTPADLVELIDTLQVASAGKSSQVRRSGHGTHVAWDEETRITAGKAGVELPSRLTVEAQVFEGVELAARFDVRVIVAAKVGEPVGFKLDAPRLADAVRTHSRAAVDFIRGNVPEFVPVFEGFPS